ncbi:MAG: hypothetical protein ACREMP_04635 [Candidatus Tyrphobacter sp.]
MFLFPDGTLVIQLVNFAIFFAILNVVFLRPVAAAIRRRREFINGVVADYDRYQEQASALRDEAQSIRAAARREAERRVAQARAQTTNETATLASEFAAKAKVISDDASRRVGAELDAARAQEAPIVGALAETMLERVFAESGA